MQVHLYGVIAADADLPMELEGRAGAPVRAVGDDRLAVLVSDLDDETRVGRSDLLTHAHVLEAVADAATVARDAGDVIEKTSRRVVADMAPSKAVKPPKRESVQKAPSGGGKPAAIEKPASPDDLKAISGIGPKLETVLNGLGVWTYAQIAVWSPAEIAWVDDHLGFNGRIGRDGWIAQAAELAKTRD